MPDAGFSRSAGAAGGLVPLALVVGAVALAFVLLVVTVILPA